MADIFDVIADGTRRDILRLLRDDDGPDARGVSVSEIVAQIGVSQPTVSKHLKVLREARLVVVREQGQHRFYSLQSAPLDEVRTWVVSFVPPSAPEAAAAPEAAPAPEAAADPAPAADPDTRASVAAPEPAAQPAPEPAARPASAFEPRLASEAQPAAATPPAGRPVVLPAPAARLADAAGRVAASAVRAWEGVLQKLPGR